MSSVNALTKEQRDLYDRVRVIQHFAQAIGMSDALGAVMIVTMVNHGLIKRPSDLYALTKEALAADGFVCDLVAASIVGTIDKFREPKMADLITGLGIPHIGVTTADLLAGSVHTPSGLIGLVEEDLRHLGLGPMTTRSFLNWARDPSNIAELRALSLHLTLE